MSVDGLFEGWIFFFRRKILFSAKYILFQSRMIMYAFQKNCKEVFWLTFIFITFGKNVTIFVYYNNTHNMVLFYWKLNKEICRKSCSFIFTISKGLISSCLYILTILGIFFFFMKWKELILFIYFSVSLTRHILLTFL